VRAFELEAFNIPDVKGEPLPLSGMNPGSFRCAVDTLMNNPPGIIVIDEPMAPELPFGGSQDAYEIGEAGYRVSQINENHARSFRIEHPVLADGIEDEYGNSFSSFTLKGNNFTYPGLIESPTAQHDIMAYGLQESAGIRRVLRASDYMRKLGIGTEFVIGLSEPKELPYIDLDKGTDEAQFLGRNAYKQKLIFDRWNELDEDERTLESLDEIKQAINGTAYYISIRAMDSDYRLSDLNRDSSVSTRVRTELSLDDEPISLEQYYFDHLIPTVAKNFASMHSGGLAHRFPHHGNISALGSIVDLDSVYGEPLGLEDEAITIESMAYDIEVLLHGFNAVKIPEIMVVDIVGTFMTAYIKELTELKGHDPAMALDVLSTYRKRLKDNDWGDNYIAAFSQSMSEKALDDSLEKYFPGIVEEESKRAAAESQRLQSELQIDTDPVRELFLDYILGHPYQLIDSSFTELVNEYRERIENGYAEEALLELFAKEYREMFVGATRLAPGFIAELMDNTELNMDAVGLLCKDLAKQVVLENIAKIAKVGGEYIDAARVDPELLIGDASVSYLSGKGNMIYDSVVDDPEVLRAIVIDPLKETRIAITDPTKSNNFTYAAGDDIQLLQVVVFDWGDYDGSGYSYSEAGESKVDSFNLGFDADRAIMFMTRDNEGKIIYDIVTGDPELFEKQTVNDPAKFTDRWSGTERYIQERLFDPYEGSAAMLARALGLSATHLK
jgi:hypothetical protein